MTTPETYERLAAVPREVVVGLIVEQGAENRQVEYEHTWQRESALWDSVRAALEAAERGDQPQQPTSAPPRWLQPLVNREIAVLARRRAWTDSFGVIRLLERLDVLRVEHDDEYILAMINALDFNRWRGADLPRALREDPALIRELWRLFEVEGGGEVSLTNVDNFTSPQGSWALLIIGLVDDGTLAREKVLWACLDALQRDFSAYRARWYTTTYGMLAPTTEEVARDQAIVRSLLNSSVTAIATFAVKTLAGIEAEHLDDEETVVALSSVMTIKTKTAALAGLRLVTAIVDRRPELVGVAATTVAGALLHDAADVQRRAVAMLQTFGEVDLARDAAEDLLPSIRAQLGITGAKGQAESAVGQSPSGPSATPIDLQTQPEVVAVTKRDLLERLAAVLEDPTDPIELELVIAALAVMKDPAALKPLRQRAAKISTEGDWQEIGASLRKHVAHLVLEAAGERTHTERPIRPIEAFLRRRLDEVHAVITGASPPRTLLATPDSADGWVSAEALCRRLNDSSHAPSHHDVVAALLRLSPSDRAAWPAAEVPSDNLGVVFAHALGYETPAASAAVLARPSWWVAASRARCPTGDDPLLLAAGLDRNGQGRPLSPAIHPHTDRNSYWPGAWHAWRIDVGEHPGTPAADQPTVLRGGQWQREERGDWLAWAATVWPHDAEHFVVEQLFEIIRVAQDNQVSYTAGSILTGLLRHPGRIGPVSAVALAAGLAADRPEHRTIAVDAVTRHLRGQLTPAMLASAMALTAPYCRANRWVHSLRDLSDASPDGSNAVVAILDGLIPHLPYDHHGLSGLVELLHEQLITSGRHPAQELKAWLTALTGNSRSARAARQIANLPAA